MPNPRNTAWGGTGGDGSTSVVGNPNAIPMPVAPAANDVLVWDGDSWEPTKVAQSQTAAGNKITRGDIDDGPPGSPTDGDIWIAEDVGAENSGVAWQFIYNADSSSSFKWECLSGAPIVSEVMTAEGTASTSYAALASAGPSLVLPRAGDYDVQVFATISNTSDGATSRMSYDIGGTGAVDADAIRHTRGTNSSSMSGVKLRRKAGLTAVTLTAKYKVSAGTGTFEDRVMIARPLRVS